MAYKKDVADTRESPALKIVQFLQNKGAKVSYNDPYVPQIQLAQNVLNSVELSEKKLASADCVVIATDHSCYDLSDIADKASLLFDARGSTCNLKQANIERLGEGIH